METKILVQAFIAIFGVTAITLSQSGLARRRRYACLFGLAGQPFWFVSAWSADQWGIFILCFLYTLAWLKGLWTNWIVPWLDHVLLGDPYPDYNEESPK